MKPTISVLLPLLVFCSFSLCALAHDPAIDDSLSGNSAANEPLPTNYVITFTLLADGTKQEAEIITARRGVSFDLVDNPEHSLRFKGELKPADDGRVTLAYTAMLITVANNASNAKEVATTSGEGAILLEPNKPLTILRSARQQLAISVRPSLPGPTPAASNSPARP